MAQQAHDHGDRLYNKQIDQAKDQMAVDPTKAMAQQHPEFVGLLQLVGRDQAHGNAKAADDERPGGRGGVVQPGPDQAEHQG